MKDEKEKAQPEAEVKDETPEFYLPTWEYHRVKTPDRQPVIASVLNEHGRNGWELVSVLHVGAEINYIFKRPKPEK